MKLNHFHGIGLRLIFIDYLIIEYVFWTKDTILIQENQPNQLKTSQNSLNLTANCRLFAVVCLPHTDSYSCFWSVPGSPTGHE